MSSVPDIYFELKKLRERVAHLEREKAGIKVAFSASLGFGDTDYNDRTTSQDDSDGTSPLVYGKVITNIGDGYNSSTGIFTAPVGGVYHFTMYSTHSMADKQNNQFIYKNGDRLVGSVVKNPDGFSHGSNGVTVELVQGDQVSVRFQYGWVYDDASNYSTFNGFMLYTK